MNILHNVHVALVLPVIKFFKDPTYFLQYSMINDFILIICNTVARINAILFYDSFLEARNNLNLDFLRKFFCVFLYRQAKDIFKLNV